MGAKIQPSAEDRARFAQLTWFLEHAEAIRFVDYARAERDCIRLAEKLVAELGTLAECRFAAIPRGGFVVLGMLARVLGLEAEQLRPSEGPAKKVVLVDDCLLTGARFGAEMKRYPGARIWFAHLYSNPAARRAIEGGEDRVEGCLAAHDLPDFASELLPDPAVRAAWRARWIEKLGGERYWFGQTGVLGFSWGEPTHLFWNESSARVESGWRFFSPERCLGSRVSGQPFVESLERSWRVPDGVVFGDFEDRLLLFRREDGEGFALDGVGREMWNLLAASGDLESVLRSLRNRYRVGAPELSSDLESFVAELEAQGLIERLA